MSGRSDAAKAKAARLAAMRHRPTVDPASLDERTAADEHDRPQAAPAVAVEHRQRPRQQRVKPVRITLDLAPELHAEFGRWCADAARELGRGRVTNAEALRVLVRRLLADDALAAEVRDALGREGQ